jgi:hypothetical protein
MARRAIPASCSSTGRQESAESVKPCNSRIGGPSPATSSVLVGTSSKAVIRSVIFAVM